MDKRLRQPTGAAGSLFLIVHNVKQRDQTGPSTSKHARGRTQACGNANLCEAEGGVEPGVRRAQSRAHRAVSAWNSAGLDPPACRRRVFCPPPVNPVVVTLAWVDRSPIGRAPPRARPTTRSVG